VIITSSGQRDLSPALTPKCIRLTLSPPDTETITRIVEARFDPQVAQDARELIHEFVMRRENSEVTLEQLFDTIHLIQARKPVGAERDQLVTELLKPLDKPATY